MKKSKVLTIVILAVAMLLLMSACGLVDNISTFKENQQPEDNKNGATEDVSTKQDENSNPDDNSVIEKDLDLSTDQPAAEAKPDDAADQQTADANSKEVVLYFTADDGKSLAAETRSIPKQEGLARATINQLIAGPREKDLSPTLPAAVILEDINIADGICTVDFSAELLSDLPQDQTAQMLAVYSIVNTLSQFEAVSEVRILVDGKAINNLGGVDASTTIAPMHNW